MLKIYGHIVIRYKSPGKRKIIYMKKSISGNIEIDSGICRNIVSITLYMAIFLCMSFSCGQKNMNKTEGFPQGRYKGVFTRSSPLAKYASSHVTLTFTENKFSGESDQRNYPAICNGTYRVTGSEIEFTNECMWTADFDWTYILKDKFYLRIDGDKMELTKSEGDHTDQYTLTREKL
ncbi:MAG: hypothetical protein C0490_14170 [Marivirga sp.]|nr:hypothetical protein [Marivirga sp.]